MQPRIPQILPRIALVAMLLAACSPSLAGPGGSAAPDASSRPPAPPLACEAAGYPCASSAVPPETRARSDELADAGTEAVAGGLSVSEAAARLEAESGVVEVEHDEDAIRFRLDGGRPTWILTSREGAPETAVAAPRAGLVGPDRTFDGPRIPPSRVVGTDPEAKSAIVLDFYNWFRQGSAGSVAEILGRTRGYEARVNYQLNISREDRTVSWDALMGLAGYDVVYIDSIGGQVCTDTCKAMISIHDVGPDETDAPDIVGVEAAASAFGKSYGIGADFFLHHYGGAGIEDALVVLDVQDIGDENLRLAIAGESSTYMSWAGGLVPEDWRAEKMVKLMDTFATTGRDPVTVTQVIGLNEFVYAPTGAHLTGWTREKGNAARVREIVWLRDPDTGESLAETGEIRILGTPGDGEPDTVPFLVDVDGMTDEQAAAANLNVMIDNTQAEPLLVSSGRQQSDHMWQLGGQYQLPWDVPKGKKLRISAYVQLPEGGLSSQTLELPVSETKLPELGNVWEGTAASVEETLWPGVTFHRTAHVQFTRDPSNSPNATSVSFYMSGGEMTWEIKGASKECTPTVAPVTVPLIADEYSYLMFDVDEENRSVTYWGQADVDGPSVEVTMTCIDGRTFKYGTRAEGTFFSIPSTEQHAFGGGSTLTGEYVFPAKIPTTYTWELTKVK